MEQKRQGGGPNIYLIGFMGVGKSAVGRALARALRLEFIDSDHAIEQQAGMPIARIFKEQGEAAFRRMERDFIESGHPKSGAVVSCGGGLPLQPGMKELLAEKGLVVCLFASIDTIISRTVGNPKRPLLNVDHPEQRIRTLMEEREPIYLSAGIGVSTERRTIPEVVKSISRMYHRRRARNLDKES